MEVDSNGDNGSADVRADVALQTDDAVLDETRKKRVADNWARRHFFPFSESSLSLLPSTAAILVGPGSTPESVCAAALHEIEGRWDPDRPWDITWYTPDGGTCAHLMQFRKNNRSLTRAARTHVLPGEVYDPVGSVVGPDTVKYVKRLPVSFSHSILGVHRLDLRTGRAYFAHDSEVSLQRALARKAAVEKHVFLPPGKFGPPEGRRGYGITDLLKTAEKRVAIHCFANDTDVAEKMRCGFSDLRALCGQDALEHRELVLCLIHENGSAEYVSSNDRPKRPK
jgi:hypothetical protein